MALNKPSASTGTTDTESQSIDTSGEVITSSELEAESNLDKDGVTSEITSDSNESRSDADTNGETTQSNAGLIAGIIILVVAVLGGIAAAIYFLVMPVGMSAVLLFHQIIL